MNKTERYSIGDNVKSITGRWAGTVSEIIERKKDHDVLHIICTSDARNETPIGAVITGPSFWWSKINE